MKTMRANFWRLSAAVAVAIGGLASGSAWAGLAFFIDGSAIPTTNHNVGTVPVGAVATVGRLVSVRVENQGAGTVTNLAVNPGVATQIDGLAADTCTGGSLAPAASCTFQIRVGRATMLGCGGISTSLGVGFNDPSPQTATLGFFGTGGVWADPTLTLASATVVRGNSTILNVTLNNPSQTLIDGSAMSGAQFTMNRSNTNAQFTGTSVNTACAPNFSPPVATISAGSVSVSGAQLTVPGSGQCTDFNVSAQGFAVGSTTFSIAQFTGVTNGACATGNQVAGSATLNVVDGLATPTNLAFGGVLNGAEKKLTVSVEFASGVMITRGFSGPNNTFFDNTNVTGPGVCTLGTTTGVTNCSYEIRYRPTAVALGHSASFDLAPGVSVPLTGDGLAGVTVAPSGVNLPRVAFGRTTVVVNSPTLTNTSGAPLTLTSTSAANATLTVGAGTCPLGGVLNAGNACTLALTYLAPHLPTPVAGENPIIETYVNTPVGSIFFDTTADANAWVDPLNVTFTPTSVPAGTSSRLQFELQQPARLALTGITLNKTLPTNLLVAPVPNVGTSGDCGGLTVTANANATSFSVAGGMNGNATFPAIASCTIAFDVRSTVPSMYSVGFVAGDITNSPFLANPNPSNTATLTVTGGAPPMVSFSPMAPITLGDALEGQTVFNVDVAMTNTGAAAFTLNSRMLTNMADFSFTTPMMGPECTPTTTLMPAGVCYFRVRFLPTVGPPGVLTTTVSFTDTASNTITFGAVNGNRVRVKANNTSVNLGLAMQHVPVLGGAKLQAATAATNAVSFTTGTSPVTVNGITVAAPFGATLRSPCALGTPLPSNTTCFVDLTLSGPTAGTFGPTTLTIDTNENDPTVSLSGVIKDAPSADNNPVLVSESPIGQIVTATINITNTNSSGMRLDTIALPPGPFTLMPASTCMAGTTILPMGGSCSVVVQFAPVGPGAECYRTGVAGCANNTIANSAVAYGFSSDIGGMTYVPVGTAYQALDFRSGTRLTGNFSISPVAATRDVPARLRLRLINASSESLNLMSAFSFTFPAGIKTTPTPNVAVTGAGCMLVTATATPLSGSMSFSGIWSGGSTCDIEVDICADVAGTYTIGPIAAGALVPNAPAGPNLVPITATNFTGNPGPTPTLTPATKHFRTPVAATSPQTFALSNPSATETLTVNNVTLSGATTLTLGTAPILPCSTTYPFMIPPLGACNLLLNHSPTMVATEVGMLNIEHNGGAGPGFSNTTIAVTAEGQKVPVTGIGFGTNPIPMAGGSTVMTISLSNTSDLSLAGVGFTFGPPGGVTFSAPATSCMPGGAFVMGGNLVLNSATVPSGMSCTVSVTATVAATGMYTFNLAADSIVTPYGLANTPSSSVLSVGVMTSSLSVAPSPVTFAATNLGQQSAIQTVTITSTGTAPLNITGLVPTSEFTVVANNCAAPVAVGASCTVDMRFTPSATGLRTGTLTINSDSPSSPFALALQGTGNPGVALTATPTPANLGSAAVGMPATNVTITVSNTSIVPVTVSAVTSSAPTEFAVVSNTCTAAPVPASTGTCQVVMRLTPTAVGPRTATLSIAHGGAGSPLVVPLTGAGTGGSLAAAPSPLDLGMVVVGQTGSNASITVTNVSGAPVAITSVSTSVPLEFEMVSTTCLSGMIAPMGTCTATLRLKPTAAGARTGNLIVAHGGAGSPLTVPLTGTGIAAGAITALPTSLDFATVDVGAQAATQTVTLTNGSGATISLVSFGRSPTADYQIVGGTCTSAPLPLMLAAGGSCSVLLTFTPQGVGSIPGTLTFNFGLTPAPASLSVALTGTGAGARLAVSKSFSPATIDDGASTQLSIVLRNLSSQALTQVQLVDNYPAGLTNTLAAVPALNDCNFSLNVPPGGNSLNITAGTIAANQTCNVGVTVGANTGQASLPTQGAILTNTISRVSAVLAATPAVAASIDASSTLAANLTVTQRSRPVIRITPSTLPAFPDTPVTQSSAPQTIEIANVGNAPLTFTTPINVSGPHAMDFTQTSTCSGPLPALVAGQPPATCSVTLRMRPSSTGMRTGVVNVVSNDPTSPSVAIALSGNAIPFAAVVELSATSLDFGSLTIETTSADRTITLRNRGNKALTIASIDTRNIGDFSQSNTCGGAVAVGGECVLTIRFRPIALGGRNGEIVINDDAGGSPRRIGLTGIGVPLPRPVLSAGGSLAFGETIVGANGAILMVAPRNTGNAPMQIVSAVPRTMNFAMVTFGCAAPVAPGDACAIFVRFTPQQVGNISDVLFIDAGEAGGASVSLFGTGVEAPKPVLTLASERVNFGNQIVNTASAARVVEVRNTGNAVMPIVSASMQGAAAADYALTNGCPAEVSIGGSCAMTIVFTPRELGERNAELRVETSGANANVATLAITGAGVPVPAPFLQLSASQMTYGNSGVGGSLATQSITLTNTGGLPLNIASIVATGDFAITQACPTTTLAVGASCVVQVAFVPTDIGTRVGQLRIASNASASPSVVPLSGRGCGVFNLLGLRTGVLSCGS